MKKLVSLEKLDLVKAPVKYFNGINKFKLQWNYYC